LSLRFFLVLTLIFTGSANAQVSFETDTLKNGSILSGDSTSSILTDLFSSKYRTQSIFRFLPLSLHGLYNTNRPFAENDGNFSAENGFQSIVQLGMAGRWKNVEWRVSPMLHTTLPTAYETSKQWGTSTSAKRNELSLQGTFIKFHVWKFSARAAEGNMLRGATNIDHLMLGSNAPGFRHLGFGSSIPISIGIGKLEFDLVAGSLRAVETSLPQENNYLKPFPSSYTTLGNRQFNGLTVVFHPAFMKNSSFGLIRQFQYTNNEMNRLNDPLNKYLPVLTGIFKNSIGGRAEDTIKRDQQISLNYALRIPSINTELSLEYGWNDHKWNSRDLLLSLPHSLAYIISLKKLFPRKTGYGDLVLEYTHMKQQLEYTMREGGDWYSHYQSRFGFTHQGQILGVGGANGQGLNKFTVQYRSITPKNNWMFRYQLIANDHSYLEWPIWKDHVFSVANSRNFGRLTIRNEVKAIQSSGYAFVLGKHKTSFQTNCSIYYRLQ
jgi:hypothetical protein